MSDLLRLAATHGTPLYVYDGEELARRGRALLEAFQPLGARLFYAAKANGHPEILRRVHALGFGIDAVSEGEVRMALHAGVPPAEISFNGNNVSGEEMAAVHELGVEVIVDSVAQLDRFGRLFPGARVGLRYNPPEGEGHHAHVITGGPDSKFGIGRDELDLARRHAAEHGLRIVGLQQHVGSGILEPEPLTLAADRLLEVAGDFPDLDWLDFGGGFGIPYRPEDRPLDLGAVARDFAPRIDAFRAARGRPDLEVRFEPGRAVVGTCGTLLTRVTAVKARGAERVLGTDTGFNHLLRPALYGSFHRITNLSRPDAPSTPSRVAGNVCESGDLFARERELPRAEEGDLLAIHDVGAYGMAMASSYNLRGRPAEVLRDGSEARLIRRRESFEDLLRGLEGPGEAGL